MKRPSARWIWQYAEWPQLTWNAAALAAPLSRARRTQGEVAGLARLLEPQLDAAARLEVLTLDGVTTSAIEGEKLDPNALRSSIARRLGLPTAGLPRASRSVEGLVDVLLDAAASFNRPLTLKRLCGWQAALFPTGRSGLRRIRVGALRGEEPMRIVSGPAGRERVHYEAPPRSQLARDMRVFLAWFNQPPADLDGLVRAGLAHLWFEILHPFEDGNGRVGRALLDMAMAQDERRSTRLYSLSARLSDRRDEYYQALERASRDNLDVTTWLLWFVEQVDAAARSSEATVASVLRKARFWIRYAQTELNQRQRKTLNRMLDTEPDGFVGGMTNDKYRNLTKASPATAQRDLADLVAKRCLVLRGGGRAVRYEIAAMADTA